MTRTSNIPEILTANGYAPVGARVHCRYWDCEYKVVSHNADGTVTVKWLTGPTAGQAATHFTAFERGRDRILEMLDHNDEPIGRAGLRDHAVTAADCWCAEHLSLHNPTVAMTLDTHNRIRGIAPAKAYQVFWNGNPIGTMDGSELASRLRLSTQPESITFKPVSTMARARILH